MKKSKNIFRLLIVLVLFSFQKNNNSIDFKNTVIDNKLKETTTQTLILVEYTKFKTEPQKQIIRSTFSQHLGNIGLKSYNRTTLNDKEFWIVDQISVEDLGIIIQLVNPTNGGTQKDLDEEEDPRNGGGVELGIKLIHAGSYN